GSEGGSGAASSSESGSDWAVGIAPATGKAGVIALHHGQATSVPAAAWDTWNIFPHFRHATGTNMEAIPNERRTPSYQLARRGAVGYGIGARLMSKHARSRR